MYIFKNKGVSFTENEYLIYDENFKEIEKFVCTPEVALNIMQERHLEPVSAMFLYSKDAFWKNLDLTAKTF